MQIEIMCEAGDWPAEPILEALATKAIAACIEESDEEFEPDTELSVVFTDDEAIRELNKQWRGKDKPTNVLSFPAMEQHSGGLLGDIILASETVHREAEIESVPLEHHISHLIVHGFLHICGYDHETDEEANRMESLEIRILERLDIHDPYAV